MERGDPATARDKAAAAFRTAAGIGRRGREILEATGAPGRELHPIVRREARR